jgi:hypothetical protein
VRADVYGFALPARGHLKTAFSLLDGFLKKVYGPAALPKVRRQYADFLQKHRLNPDDIYRGSPPDIEDLRHYRDQGLNTFNVMNLVRQRDETWVANMPKEAYTPAFRDKLVERLEPTMAKLRKHGLVDNKPYVYAFDELNEDFFPVVRDVFGTVKKSYPELHTLTTARIPPLPEFMKDLDVDWLVPLTPLYDPVQADRCRAAGLEVWSYVCCVPVYPYANWMANFPLIESRVISWQAFHQKMDGLLYWGLNIWDREHNDRPLDPASGPLLDWSITSASFTGPLHGDGRLLYAGKDGPIGSIRLANIRDGLEDYEYLWLLGQKTSDVEAAREACLPVTESLTCFTRDPEVLYERREAIARAIMSHSSAKSAR